MKISDLERKIKEFKNEHGNVEVCLEYFCEECEETHLGHDYILSLEFDNTLKLSIRTLGE